MQTPTSSAATSASAKRPFPTLPLITLAAALLVGACGAPAESGPAPVPEVWDTGECSLAHEPSTTECRTEMSYVMRCPNKMHNPKTGCDISLEGDAHVWCCPVPAGECPGSFGAAGACD